jgi:hypothetical protein
VVGAAAAGVVEVVAVVGLAAAGPLLLLLLLLTLDGVLDASLMGAGAGALLGGLGRTDVVMEGDGITEVRVAMDDDGGTGVLLPMTEDGVLSAAASGAESFRGRILFQLPLWSVQLYD